MMATIVFNPAVALLASMTASSRQQSVSISRRSSGLSGGTGYFHVFRLLAVGFHYGLERGSGGDRIGACESAHEIAQCQDGRTSEALPGSRELVIRDRRIFVVLPVMPRIMR